MGDDGEGAPARRLRDKRRDGHVESGCGGGGGGGDIRADRVEGPYGLVHGAACRKSRPRNQGAPARRGSRVPKFPRARAIVICATALPFRNLIGHGGFASS